MGGKDRRKSLSAFKELGYRKMCACSVPPILAPLNKSHGRRFAQPLPTRYENCDVSCLDETVSGYQTQADRKFRKSLGRSVSHNRCTEREQANLLPIVVGIIWSWFGDVLRRETPS